LRVDGPSLEKAERSDTLILGILGTLVHFRHYVEHFQELIEKNQPLISKNAIYILTN